MRLKERVIESVQFTDKEMEALNLIAFTSCRGIGCMQCPFHATPNRCIKAELKRIARNSEVYNE